MIRPTKHHYLDIPLPNGKHVRARITSVQPHRERHGPRTANMVIVTHDWIEAAWHPASFTFAISSQTCRGRYFPASYTRDEDGYTYHGIFESEQADATPERHRRP